MCGNGAATGKGITVVAHRSILKVLAKGCPVCFVAAAGTMMRGTVDLLSATSLVQAFAASFLDSVCPFKFGFEVYKSMKQYVNQVVWAFFLKKFNY